MRNRFFLLLTILGCMLAGHPAAAARQSFFVMDETVSGNLKPFPKWSGMMGRYEEAQKISDSECGKRNFHPCVILQWREMIASLKGKKLRDQLDKINEWSNTHPYIIDQLNWGVDDYWETPYEFMSVNGDCEDYAISKYYSLRALDVPEDKLRIIVLQDLNLGGVIHAVLGVYDGDDFLILDNQIKQVRSAYKIYHYRPIYGVNENHWWAYTPKG